MNDEKDPNDMIAPELMDDLLTDQARIRARLDQVETAVKHNGAALMMTIIAVLLIGGAVYMIVRELEEEL